MAGPNSGESLSLRALLRLGQDCRTERRRRRLRRQTLARNGGQDGGEGQDGADDACSREGIDVQRAPNQAADRTAPPHSLFTAIIGNVFLKPFLIILPAAVHDQNYGDKGQTMRCKQQLGRKFLAEKDAERGV